MVLRPKGTSHNEGKLSESNSTKLKFCPLFGGLKDPRSFQHVLVPNCDHCRSMEAASASRVAHVAILTESRPRAVADRRIASMWRGGQIERVSSRFIRNRRDVRFS